MTKRDSKNGRLFAGNDRWKNKAYHHKPVISTFYPQDAKFLCQKQHVGADLVRPPLNFTATLEEFPAKGVQAVYDKKSYGVFKGIVLPKGLRKYCTV
jgi:hypothetical protein